MANRDCPANHLEDDTDNYVMWVLAEQPCIHCWSPKLIGLAFHCRKCLDVCVGIVVNSIVQ